MDINNTPIEKSTTERQLEKAKERLEKLKAKRKAELQAINKANRKKRTRQLIKIGGILAKYFNIDPLNDDPTEVERFLQKNVLGAEAITKDHTEPINIVDLWREFVEEERRRQDGTGD